jgi:Tfp pilus assembly protein PilV
MTLVEVMLAASVIAVAALGTLCYEYLCVDHIRFARAQLAATRVGQLLIEDWKSSGGSADYNPENLHMGFVLPPELPAGNFVTTIDGLTLHITMSHSDVATDPVAGVTLRRINVVVHWRKDFGNGAVDNDDPGVNLTTYVRRDQ